MFFICHSKMIICSRMCCNSITIQTNNNFFSLHFNGLFVYSSYVFPLSLSIRPKLICEMQPLVPKSVSKLNKSTPNDDYNSIQFARIYTFHVIWDIVFHCVWTGSTKVCYAKIIIQLSSLLVYCVCIYVRHDSEYLRATWNAIDAATVALLYNSRGYFVHAFSDIETAYWTDKQSLEHGLCHVTV